MRTLVVAVVAMTASVALADDIDEVAPAGGVGTRFLLELPRRGISAGRQRELVGTGLHLPHRRRLPFRAAEFSGYAGRLPVGAISRRRGRRAYDHGQQRHRIGPKGYRYGLYQAQSGGANSHRAGRKAQRAPFCDIRLISDIDGDGERRDGIGKSSRHSRCDRRVSRPGDRDRVWTDRASRKAAKTGSERRAAGATGCCAAGRQGAGG